MAPLVMTAVRFALTYSAAYETAYFLVVYAVKISLRIARSYVVLQTTVLLYHPLIVICLPLSYFPDTTLKRHFDTS